MTLSTCPGWGACARRHRCCSSSWGRSTSLYQLLAGEVTDMNDYLAQSVGDGCGCGCSDNELYSFDSSPLSPDAQPVHCPCATLKQTKTITRPVSTTITITTVIVNQELFVMSPNILRSVNWWEAFQNIQSNQFQGRWASWRSSWQGWPRWSTRRRWRCWWTTLRTASSCPPGRPPCAMFFGLWRDWDLTLVMNSKLGNSLEGKNTIRDGGITAL